jgi:PAS domain S-box-containing protein
MKTKILFNKSWISFAILIIGIVLTIIIASNTTKNLKASEEHEFSLVCHEIKTKISTRLHAHALLLRSGAAFFAASDLVTRTEWKIFSETSKIDKNLPGKQGVGCAMIIKKDQLQKHIQEVRKEGFSDYKVRPEGNREIYTSIVYIEPFRGRNLRAFGYDMYSEHIRRKAMDYARDYDVAAITGKVQLVQETTNDIQSGTLMYVPVYKKGLPINTINERRAAIIGWVYSPYRMADLMQGILGTRGLNDIYKIHLQIFDNDNFNQNSLIYDSQQKNVITQKDYDNKKRILPIEFNGKKWNLRFSKSEEHIYNLKSKDQIYLISGLIISLLLFGLSLSLFNTLSNAQQIAKQLTSKLEESEANFKQLFDINPDTINIVRVSDSKIVEVNNKFQDQLGFSHDDVIGKTTLELNIWANPTERPYILNEIQEKGDIINYESLFKRKDGSIFTGILSCKLIDFRGEPHILCVTRDITDRKKIEAELRATEFKLKTIYDLLEVGITLTDEQGNIIESNRASEKLLGLIKEEQLKRNYAGKEWKIVRTDLSIMPPNEFANVRAMKENTTITGVEMGIVKEDNEITWLVVTATPLNIPGYGVVISYVDITERKLVELAVLEAKENSETNSSNITAILGSTVDSIWAFDTEYRIIYINHVFRQEFYQAFGVWLESGVSLIESLPEALRPIWKPRYDKVLNNREQFTIEDAVPTNNGILYIQISMNPIIKNEKVIGGTCFGSDITYRKQAEEELKASREQLRNFASHLQRVREKERVSITLEIHDSLAQFLVALKMDIGICRNKLLKGDDLVKKEEILAEIEKFIKKTEYTINSARNIMNGLRPDQLELLGLVESVEVHLRKFEENHHLKYTFENNLLNTVIPPEEELALFRILQESLNNTLKHAMATQVVVKLIHNSGKLTLEITDNGVGFDIKNSGRTDSYGLIGMSELVRMLGGTFDITSKLGEGTTVKVEMPT